MWTASCSWRWTCCRLRTSRTQSSASASFLSSTKPFGQAWKPSPCLSSTLLARYGKILYKHQSALLGLVFLFDPPSQLPSSRAEPLHSRSIPFAECCLDIVSYACSLLSLHPAMYSFGKPWKQGSRKGRLFLSLETRA